MYIGTVVPLCIDNPKH